MNAFILSNDSELRTLVSRICAMRNPPINVLAALPSMHADPIPPMSGQPDLVILDAQHLQAPALARIRLPRRVPQGFHGNWIKRSALVPTSGR